jgi:branched-chain amino acid transport system ATP-binding protein
VSSSLAIEDLHVRYGSVVAVRGASLSVDAGQIVAMVGPNGAGKSSTLGAICGSLDGATVSGSITVDGAQLSRLAPEDRLRRGIALVPQGRRIFGQLTVRENLVLSGLVERDQKAREERIGEMHELFPILAEFGDRAAGLLSGGQQQMLAIARALMSRPGFVILDEPSLGLSPKIVAEVFDVLARLRDARIGVLLVEQNAMRAIELSSRAYMMSRGVLHELPGGITPAELRERYMHPEARTVAS